MVQAATSPVACPYTNTVYYNTNCKAIAGAAVLGDLHILGTPYRLPQQYFVAHVRSCQAPLPDAIKMQYDSSGVNNLLIVIMCCLAGRLATSSACHAHT
jgi:hypothetical protein